VLDFYESYEAKCACPIFSDTVYNTHKIHDELCVNAGFVQ